MCWEPTELTTDEAFQALDDALAGVRALSRQIRQGAEAGQGDRLDSLCALREEANAKVSHWLRITDAILEADPHTPPPPPAR